jgi:hypothetical protein
MAGAPQTMNSTSNHTTRSTADKLQKRPTQLPEIAATTRRQFQQSAAENGSETVIVTADNSPTARNGVKAPCWGQHTQISCFACPYLTTNSVPKILPLSVGFVSGALNLDPKTYL